MTKGEYDQRTATMLLTFSNDDVRRAISAGNVVHVGAPLPRRDADAKHDRSRPPA